jgi:putative transcriptional regulator
MRDLKFTMEVPEQDNLYFIHNPELIPNSIEISEWNLLGGDFESTKELINDGTIERKYSFS